VLPDAPGRMTIILIHFKIKKSKTLPAQRTRKIRHCFSVETYVYTQWSRWLADFCFSIPWPSPSSAPHNWNSAALIEPKKMIFFKIFWGHTILAFSPST
jgi:hypothetical protein